jgi:hypothetical protein
VIRVRCAPAAEARGDPLHGTAPPATRFVVVEQPGAWGSDVLAGSRLEPHVVEHLVARCRALGARLLLVRRVHREPDAPLRVGVADARRGHERMAWSTFLTGDELLGLTLAPPDDAQSGAPILLTCTHGRKDPCCARRGWPVAQALTAACPERTWQCSHVGGDRFAANVLALPYGLYFGHVTPGTAIELVEALDRGELLPDRLRGRSIDPPVVQSALWHVRRVLDERSLDGVVPVSWRQAGADRFEVLVIRGVDTMRVLLRRVIGPVVDRPTCGAREPAQFHHHELVSIDAV